MIFYKISPKFILFWLIFGIIACRKTKNVSLISQKETQNKANNSPQNHSESKIREKDTYLIKISANDANSAKIWLDTIGKTLIGKPEDAGTDRNSKWAGAVAFSSPASLNTWSKEGAEWANAAGNNVRWLMTNTADKVFWWFPNINWQTIQRKPELITTILASRDNANPNDAQITQIKIKYQEGDKSIEIKHGSLEIGQDFSQEYQIPANINIQIKAQASQNGKTVAIPEVLKIGSDSWANPEKFRSEATGHNLSDRTIKLTIAVSKNGKPIINKSIDAQKSAELNISVNENS